MRMHDIYLGDEEMLMFGWQGLSVKFTMQIRDRLDTIFRRQLRYLRRRNYKLLVIKKKKKSECDFPCVVLIIPPRFNRQVFSFESFYIDSSKSPQISDCDKVK